MYKVIVNTLGPVGVFEFQHKASIPDHSGGEVAEYIDESGVKHVFYWANIVHIAYYPLPDPPKGK